MKHWCIGLAILAGVGAVISAGAAEPRNEGKPMKGMTTANWGTVDEKPVTLYTLTNANGMVVKITNYGCIVTEIHVPDKAGKMADVALGFDKLDGYLEKSPFFGAVAGRVANRIAKGKFTLDGKEYTLAVNNGPNALHGGKKGFDKKVWSAETPSGSQPSLRLKYHSPDGEEGYPGNVDALVVYTLTDDNGLWISYEAVTDKPTLVNLTNHSYFNLAGQGNGTILDHVMRISADQYTPVDDTLIPTGELKSVKGTPFDFTSPHAIGERIKQVGGNPVGYDHNFVFGGTWAQVDSGPPLRVTAEDPKSGRIMKMFTSEPGVQFYTGNFLDGSVTGKGGAKYPQYGGFCLEAQHFPDSINHPNFPSVVLRPGQQYQQTTIYKFSAR